MRRAPIVIAATVVGTAGVLLFKPLPPSSLTGAAAASAATGTDTSSSDTTDSASGSTPSASASATPSSTPSSSTRTSTKTGTRTVTGALETDRYGNTQVSVTITNGRITAVTTLQYNDGDPRSAEISQQAIPILRQEILSKQTAAVDAVSGATYTSNAYKASLQAALDTAGFTASDGSKASTDLQSADANLFGH